ncbi:proteinase-activated receptor 2-like [Triplophysa dalaica]|uniref:proteinase-activated receptor 2-like n=1 Tax=Triplophysa dalaica TaxID=1582913 RepID=UPI0024E03731|nr:proteinase-activated receptor 2-like [Triplophysa dalaica]
MSLAGIYRILMLSACLSFAPARPGGGRSFTAFQGKDTNNVTVDRITGDMLKSGLTTVFLPFMYIIIFALGLPSNAMAIWVMVFRAKKIHPAAIYMGNLALADLMFVILTPLKITYHLKGNNWTFGETMCKVMVGFFYGNMYCSILFIMCLSVQRYWVCAHPLSHQRKNNKLAVILSVCIWIFILVSSTPLYLYQQTVYLPDLNITTCHDVNSITKENQVFQDVKKPFYYFMVMAGLVFFIPMIIIIVAYVLLLRSLGNSAPGKRRQRAVFLIITVLITFLVCFIPSNVMVVVHYTLLAKGWTNNGYSSYIPVLCLASLNSCLDPFIYYYVSEEFREHVKNTLRCHSKQ